MPNVIQWATGNVGREAVAAVHRHESLTLVGALVYDEAKARRDVYMATGEMNPAALDATIAVHDEDDTQQGRLGTAMHAIHAIAPVCAADPVIRTFLDLPMVIGPGVLDLGDS